MRQWILRLFREHRDLEREAERNIELQTRMAEQSRVIDWLKDELGEARRGEIRATQALANYASQLKFGAVPFPDAPALPESSVSPADLAPPPPPFVRAEQLMAAKSRKFLDELSEKLKTMHGRAA